MNDDFKVERLQRQAREEAQRLRDEEQRRRSEAEAVEEKRRLEEAAAEEQRRQQKQEMEERKKKQARVMFGGRCSNDCPFEDLDDVQRPPRSLSRPCRDPHLADAAG